MERNHRTREEHVHMISWALVPARGGSKSIPHKNLASLGGRPLLDYGINAAMASGVFARIICSTDDAAIADRAAKLGVEVLWRPLHLAEDNTPVTEVALHLLQQPSMTAPDVLALIQPTSPFILGTQIRQLVEAVAEDKQALSGQTVYNVPHNYHAWNQRIVRAGYVEFMYAEERSRAYNKQLKPALSVFGNLVVVKPEALLRNEGFFATPSVALEVTWPYNLDVDSPEDLQLAEAILKSGLVRLDLVRKADSTQGSRCGY